MFADADNSNQDKQGPALERLPKDFLAMTSVKKGIICRCRIPRQCCCCCRRCCCDQGHEGKGLAVTDF
jgi:hypothetical protein